MGRFDERNPSSRFGSPEFVAGMANVKRAGIRQLVAAYQLPSDAPFVWGDEMEHIAAHVTNDSTFVSPCADGILKRLSAAPTAGSWCPEYASFMVESMPMEPYFGTASDVLARCEETMKARVQELRSVLDAETKDLKWKSALVSPLMTAFPMLGTPEFIRDDGDGRDLSSLRDCALSGNAALPDACVNQAARSRICTLNLRERRAGVPPTISIPLSADCDTDGRKVELSGVPYGPCMGCLQVTMQLRDGAEARHVYDQLLVMAPLMHALTAATPILGGHLVDTDTRWDTMCAMLDDRKASEHAQGGKSRCSTASFYVSPRPEEGLEQAMNDVSLPVDADTLSALTSAGVDKRLATHAAAMFARDLLIVADELSEEEQSELSTASFDAVQSTNWQSVRLKLPLSDGPKWRVELRTLELQPTARENAAFACFSTLLARAILKRDLWLYIPISAVDANMQAAVRRGAVTDSKFVFAFAFGSLPAVSADEEPLWSLNEIFNGSTERGFEGLVPLVRRFCEEEEGAITATVGGYLDLIAARAAGRDPTPATRMRRIVKPTLPPGSCKVTGEIAAKLLREVASLE